MLKSQTGPPQVSKMLKYSESPLSQLPYLELFQSVGGLVRAFLGGGQSRDIFRGGPVKKITLYFLFIIFREADIEDEQQDHQQDQIQDHLQDHQDVQVHLV